ncbi:MAG: hypothetical protein ACM3PW_12300 [Chlamydiota bacterium]
MSEMTELQKRIAELEEENRRLQQTVADLEHSYDITLEALGDALDLKEAQTEGHSRRVTAFAIAIARATGITADSE